MAKKPARKTLTKKSMKRTKGGIGLLLPAVQKSPATAGGALVALGDGSVRNIGN